MNATGTTNRPIHRNLPRAHHLAITLLAVIAMPIPAGAGETLFFQGLGDLPGGNFESFGFDLSADGSLVVGRSHSEFGTEAFRWENGVMTGLGTLSGGASFSSTSIGVSPDGSTAVGSSLSASGNEAFQMQSGPMIGLGDLSGGAFSSQARAVSTGGGVIVGSGMSAASGIETEAFRWENGVMTGLGDLPGGIFSSAALDVSANGSTIIGWSRSDSGFEAFRHHDGTMTGLGDLPGGGFGSVGMAVSPNGAAVVGWSDSEFGPEAFRWENDQMAGLGSLPGGSMGSIAFNVSANGSIVVGRSDSAIGNQAFIWDSHNGMRSLQDLLSNDLGLNLTGWTLSEARGVSADGSVILGTGINPDGFIEAWIVTLPEPATLPLLAIAAALRSRRRWPRRGEPVGIP
ncbi:MAG: PEP-CTERM sorting domain-containing protein [Phycisphaerae bacterium]